MVKAQVLHLDLLSPNGYTPPRASPTYKRASIWAHPYFGHARALHTHVCQNPPFTASSLGATLPLTDNFCLMGRKNFCAALAGGFREKPLARPRYIHRGTRRAPLKAHPPQIFYTPKDNPPRQCLTLYLHRGFYTFFPNTQHAESPRGLSSHKRRIFFSGQPFPSAFDQTYSRHHQAQTDLSCASNPNHEGAHTSRGPTTHTGADGPTHTHTRETPLVNSTRASPPTPYNLTTRQYTRTTYTLLPKLSRPLHPTAAAPADNFDVRHQDTLLQPTTRGTPNHIRPPGGRTKPPAHDRPQPHDRAAI